MRYATAIFLGSSLLFLIEFVSAKRLLPLLGGGAAVWTACLVFFQCALLIGYWLAHWLVTRLARRRQAFVYVALLALSLAQLAYAVSPRLAATPSRPVTSVVWLLASMIGLPFLTLAATSPLLQAWYAREATGGGAYRLYAVSNVGSLLALVVYPLALEPFLSLREQALAVAAGFAAFAIAAFVIVSSQWQATAPEVAKSDTRARERIGLARAALWIALSACGSLLLAAVTTHISQNIATIPLLWIAPLMAYLLSFVVAFGGDERWLPREATVGLGALGLGAAYFLLSKGILGTPLLVAAVGFSVALFLICLLLHTELFRRRPAERELTSFYNMVAIGGAIGAVLVGVVAPSVLDGNYELASGLAFATALVAITTWDFGLFIRVVTIVATVCMASLVVSTHKSDQVNGLARVRNFYGTLRVTQVNDTKFDATARTLYNGSISHGRQVFREDLVHAPTSYYGHTSGVGYAIDLCCEGRARRIGVIGLGAGTMAAFGKAGDTIRFYDINPAVEDVARQQFHYLRRSAAVTEVVIGDARVAMAGESPQRYDVIAVDAFSGDAIPVHLITVEALEVYRRHLAPGGIVAFHVSNRHLDLKPVVAQLAAEVGMSSAYLPATVDAVRDVWSSDWVLVTNNRAFLARPEVAKATTKVVVPATLRLWTDDYNSLLPVFKYWK